MAFRFQKRIKILPGVRVNLSKSGVSTSIGRPGATVNLRKGKVKTTVGLPGSGLSYSTETRERPGRRGYAVGGFFAGLVKGLGPIGIIGLMVAVVIIAVLVSR
ncbi:DUF4236 domain-containing protein [Variovorax sp. N23]|uniref:DUF4236 domain-containing protein n=1 Tax=Variovorax sp. N23 TaxID=2980555 RepID=UPI0021C61B47|nr:DUF4236 domain-containing protein [Variovorax sp. N23]MCU4121598.1 DUF4236 domain-containing protein [Variovorax sp. N23]